MQKNSSVLISVKSTQIASEHGPVEVITTGKCCQQGDKYCITYEESELTGMKDTTTTLTVDGGRVTLTRSGSVNSQFIFEKGARHICFYETPHGAFSIGVRTGDINVDMSDLGGHISAEYLLDIDNSSVSFNNFDMQIKQLVI